MADPILHSFYIFNETYGPREGEEVKKVLYYYPPDTDENTKVKDVGFSEAMIKFVETFTEDPCQSVHTKKQRHLYYQPEANFYMVLKLHIKKRKFNDASSAQEYHDDNLHDSVYNSVLIQAYRVFEVFMGSFANILARSRNDVNILKQRFEHFYNQYLISLQLDQCDILDVFNGISWLPLDKTMYLRFQCLVNRLEAKYPQINYTAFLCNDYLVWSGLPQKDMQIIYQYLITSLFPSHHEKEISSSTGASPRRTSGQGHHYAQFLTGLNRDAPKVFIEAKGTARVFYLIVYKSLGVCLCAFVDVDGGPLNADFYQKFDADLGGTLTDLATDVSLRSLRKIGQTDDLVKYIYFNHKNLATKSTVHVDTRKTRLVNIPVEVLSTIADINADLRIVDTESECSIKTAGEYWVVCKRSETRELYAVINNREANLIQINDEVGKLCMNQFTNMFLID